MVDQQQHGDESAGAIERGVARLGFRCRPDIRCGSRREIVVMRVPAGSTVTMLPPGTRLSKGHCYAAKRRKAGRAFAQPAGSPMMGEI
jgi:hypothetical protein